MLRGLRGSCLMWRLQAHDVVVAISLTGKEHLLAQNSKLVGPHCSCMQHASETPHAPQPTAQPASASPQKEGKTNVQ